MALFTDGLSLVLSIIASIVLTVLLFVKIIPKKFDGKFTKKLPQALHDYFNFKKLYIESILKVLFTFLSVACFVSGIFIMFIGTPLTFFANIIDAIEYDFFSDWIFTRAFTSFLSGLAITVLGPIVLRLVYEGIMMFIILVKNVIEINNKTKAPEKNIEE